jgi:hypothetical protein
MHPFGYKLEIGSDGGSSLYLWWLFLSHRGKKVEWRKRRISDLYSAKKKINSKREQISRKVKSALHVGENQIQRREKGKSVGGRL